MKILFVAQNLQMGGVQMALVNTLKQLNEDKEYSIDLFSFGDGILMDEIPNNIHLIKGRLILRLVTTPFAVVIGTRNPIKILLRILTMFFVRIFGSKKFYRFLFKLEKGLEEYDVAISYFNDIQNGYFNRGTNQYVDEFVQAKRKIAWVHTDPQRAKFNKNDCLKTYKNFERIVCVSNACKVNFDKLIPEYSKKTCVVYNMFPINEITSKAEEDIPFQNDDRINLVSVGRIDNDTKRFNLIPEVCKKLNDEGITNYIWRIVGSGPDLSSNIKLVKEYGLGRYVEFVGERSNPYPYIKHSHLFILTSAYEGYPMVVSESLLVGTPVLATKYAAIKEQIHDGFNGFSMNFDTKDMVETIKNLLNNRELIHLSTDYLKDNPIDNDIAIRQLVGLLRRDNEKKD